MTLEQAWRRTGTAGRRRAGGRRRVAAACALLLVGALAVAGCDGSSTSDASSPDKAAAPAAAPRNGDGSGSGNGSEADAGRSPAVATGSPASGDNGTASGGGKTPAPATYLVRTATLSVRTAHVEDQLGAARRLATAAGGYAGDEDTTVDAHGHARSTIQLRVPAAQYDTLLTELSGLGQLLDRKVSVDDVTGQVVDVNSRIKSQQASVSRVRGLMNKATDLTDVVSLESELSTRESALEALEAQQASLKSRTNLATITLRLSEPPAEPAAAKPKSARHDGFWTTVGHALGDGWHAFYVVLRWALVILAVTLPFLALIGLGALAYRLIRRRLGRLRA